MRSRIRRLLVPAIALVCAAEGLGVAAILSGDVDPAPLLARARGLVPSPPDVEPAALGKAVGRQELALDAIADAGVDLLLAGHNHRASSHSARELATRAGAALVIQAGTATSVRLRDEEQSFNRIDVAGGRVTLTVQSWNGHGFVSGDEQTYAREGDYWRLAKRAVVPERTA